VLVLPSRERIRTEKQDPRPGRAMKLKRTTIIFLGGAAFAAWLSAAISPGRPVAPVDVSAPAPVDASGAALASEIARLRERLRPDPRPRQPARNPFAFQSTRPAARPSLATEPAPTDAAVAAAAVDVPRLRLTLAGIAEDPAPPGGSPVRTAIIAGNGQVFLAKNGDTVTDRDVVYRVETISADSAELIDLRDSTVRRLVLK
jgi:hypothetical protein